MAITDLFTIRTRPGIRSVVHPKFGRVHFSTLRPERARQLWLAGFDRLELTAEGARVLFADANLAERKALLGHCTTPAEVEAIVQLKPSASIRKDADARLQALASGA